MRFYKVILNKNIQVLVIWQFVKHRILDLMMKILIKMFKIKKINKIWQIEFL